MRKKSKCLRHELCLQAVTQLILFYITDGNPLLEDRKNSSWFLQKLSMKGNRYASSCKYDT